MITCIIIVTPEGETNSELFKRKMKYVTGSRDGTVKVWNSMTQELEVTVNVTKGAWVTCMVYMSRSKKLAVGSANRMLSFFDLSSSSLK